MRCHRVYNTTTSNEKRFEFESQSPSLELRYLTMEAIGDHEHKKPLKDNIKLTHQLSALLSINDKSLRVYVVHGSGLMSFSLEEGSLFVHGESHSVWRIELDGKQNSSMVVNDIGPSGLYRSEYRMNSRSFGLEMNLDCLRQRNGQNYQFFSITKKVLL